MTSGLGFSAQKTESRRSGALSMPILAMLTLWTGTKPARALVTHTILETELHMVPRKLMLDQRQAMYAKISGSKLRRPI